MQNQVLYIDAALHVNLDRLEEELKAKLEEAPNAAKKAILVGSKCHPDIAAIAGRYEAGMVKGDNCIELLLGEKMKEMDTEAKTFYITNGWMKNWRKIFMEGLGWDAIDARQNFGYYDRILLLDTGTGEISDEDMLEFFEYTQVPIEICPVTLDHLKKELEEVILHITQECCT